MPRLNERHGRGTGRDSYDSQPSRSDLVRAAVDDDDPDPVKGKVIPWPKGKCKRSKAGHEAIIQLRQDYMVTRWSKECGWKPYWGGANAAGELAWYACYHEMVCRHCGKVLVNVMGRGSCPLAPGKEDEKKRVEAEAAAMPARSWRPRKKPVITGPQGYRKKRAGE
jgi:hypothetical protein